MNNNCFYNIYRFSANCLCSNSALNNDQKVSNTNCDATCIGDSSKTCGGENRIQIYNLISLYNLN